MTTDRSSRHGGRTCWCGSRASSPFGESYLSCRECGTLVVAEPSNRDLTHVKDEDRDFYGRRYWYEHQRAHGRPDLDTRSITDLSDRCLHWLTAVTKYRLPPGKVLEVGCGHGGFVSLLNEIGFDTIGSELSPWVVELAQRIFGIRVLEGPVEDLDLPAASFDLLLAMDVIEHLERPATTVQQWVDLLTPDGILVLQTPCRPSKKSMPVGESSTPDETFDELMATAHRFVEMLLPDEHLHLFTQRALRELLARAGLHHVSFEPAIFAHYDMFVVASRRPLSPLSSEAIGKAMLETPARRRIRGMLDLYELSRRQAEEHAITEADRAQRQQQIEDLHRLLVSRDEEHHHTRDRLERMLNEQNEESLEEQARLERILREQHEENLREQARLDLEIGELQQAVRGERARSAEIEASRRLVEEQRDRVEASLEELREALADSQQAVNESRRASERLRAHIDALELDIATLRATYEATSFELRDRAREVDQLRAEASKHAEIHTRALSTVEALETLCASRFDEQTRLELSLEQQTANLAKLHRLVEQYRSGRLYRSLVQLGRWRAYDTVVEQCLAEGAGQPLVVIKPKVLEWRFEPPDEGHADVGHERPVIEGNTLFDVHADGWTRPHFGVQFASVTGTRVLRLALATAPGTAVRPTTLTGLSSWSRHQCSNIVENRVFEIVVPLPAKAGWVEITIDPPFVPKEIGLNIDDRELGLLVRACRLEIDSQVDIDLLGENHRSAEELPDDRL